MSIRVEPDGIIEENENRRRDRAPLSRSSSGSLTGEDERGSYLRIREQVRGKRKLPAVLECRIPFRCLTSAATLSPMLAQREATIV